ncbi:MAG: metalloregulator ArsR/SmtB family transcription factor [Peptoniphilus sp.]|nr:metalloregulator ArsR/SmtB family transcription factor [Peptoniphilus sp.]MDD7363524.1 metalloregulator ArsR/SmtB family transcription factor [Bacillota bacterium]MDY6044773.1 metalloregulator ArsR/SmtB family transcription factor [Peptoniphilus sp.]
MNMIKEKQATSEHRREMREAAKLLRALANPIRLCLLEKLIEDGPTNVKGIGECMDVSQPNLSQHLKVLRDQGIVEAEKIQNQVFYSCEREDVRKLIETLKEVGK